MSEPTPGPWNAFRSFRGYSVGIRNHDVMSVICNLIGTDKAYTTRANAQLRSAAKTWIEMLAAIAKAERLTCQVSQKTWISADRMQLIDAAS